ncbi:alpha-glucuronidase family glycosyl hydrolase [Herbinix luporum]|uniref:Xylan alpha-1,2-glucuronidase n=1 Tax=Herbinix luporum TaxID=1679721 RepID=A0A0K8J3B9_9FIRM|nr:alpha-glucuronidase family glycosyl hydrolase [Herbinix luporum]CUH91818.1 Alpha-glucuronidase [Herbinix luporum]
MKYNKCWLNFNPINNYGDKEFLTEIIVCTGNKENNSLIIDNAIKELTEALNKMLNIKVDQRILASEDEAATVKSGIILKLTDDSTLKEEGFSIKQIGEAVYIEAKTDKGLLYGSFDLIRRIAQGQSIRGLNITENPKNNFRMLNHWDNMDGSIERGYSGNSFFFENDEIILDERIVDYARLIASVGINATVINNVNVHEAATELITDRYLGKLRTMADIFAGYGIKLYLSANFAAPIELGGLPVSDPLDKDVEEWWKNCIKKVYEYIPHFGGFLIKADSEGRPGPFTYGRTHAEGANLLARILKPYGGILIWRCFVYNCQQDWRDYKTDRARAAYDNFIGLDGEFDDNVILQIKNGPMDFQVREPVSPLFGGLKNTNMILEVQAAQEYTGHQKDVCYLIPMWKEVLDFETYAKKDGSTVADIVSGRAYNQVNCGMAAVSNTGNDYNWTGNDLAASNLYGFGRLAWNTELSSEQIAMEWIKQTFPHEDKVINTVHEILMKSWPVYEKYTSPLGIGWMVNPNNHYGPNVDGYEYDRWGTYHRADRDGMGVDRTVKNGTGYAGQYNEPLASMYENIETCPEELLLFFHYVRYDYKLKTGKTLIQHIYDTHFEGVEEVEKMIEGWKELKGLIPDDVHDRVSARFNMQLENAIEWRDRVNTYFYRKSGVKDEKGRKIF